MASLKLLNLFFVIFTWEWERGETSVLCSAYIWVLHFQKSFTKENVLMLLEWARLHVLRVHVM